MAELLLNARIRSIGFGGNGVGIISSNCERNGKVVFIPFSAPGDLVSFRITAEKGRYVEGEIVSLLEPSGGRTTPECRYYGSCGGCSLQHLSYNSACEAKEDMIEAAFRAASLNSRYIELLSPLERSEPYNWRRRSTLHISSQGEPGFYRSKTHSVIPLEECPVLTIGLSKRINSLKNIGSVIPGISVAVEIEEANGIFGVCVELNEKDYVNQADEIVSVLTRDWDRIVVKHRGSIIAHSYSGKNKFFILPLSSEHEYPSVWLSPGAFSQVNWEINCRLLKRISDWIELLSIKTAHDLFAGSGNFSLALAAKMIHTVAVECHLDLVDALQQAANSQGLENYLEIKQSSVQSFLKYPPSAVDLIIADPPRSGLGSLAAKMNYGTHLFLISCYLPSLVRDLQNLEKEGWQVQAIVPFDMFPQTTYVEVLVHLSQTRRFLKS